VKDFYEVEEITQCKILIALLERLGMADVPSLQSLAEQEGKPQDVRYAHSAGLNHAPYQSVLCWLGEAERNALQAEVTRLTSDLERERVQVDRLMNMLEAAQHQLTDQRPRRGFLDRLTGTG